MSSLQFTDTQFHNKGSISSKVVSLIYAEGIEPKSPDTSKTPLMSRGAVSNTNTTPTRVRRMFFRVLESRHEKTHVEHVLTSCPDIQGFQNFRI